MNDEVPVNQQPENVASTNSNPEAVVNTVEQIVPAGAQLAALREARGWTTLQIASQLNLANRQIQALETDNYAALPGMVIVRGFIRAYAKVLQADPAPILAAIVDDTSAPAVLLPERNTLSASFSEAKLSPSGPRGFSFKLMVGVAVLALIGVAIFAGQHLGLIPSSMSPQTSHVEKVLPIESGEIVEVPPAQSEVIEGSVAPSTNESNATSVAAPTAPVAESKVTVPESKPAALVSAPAPAPVTASKPSVAAPAVQSVAATMNTTAVTAPVVAAVPVNSKDTLAIKVREDSWVEIKRADNSVLLSRLLKAGTSEVVAVTEPVNMVIGNAAGVDVTLRGKSVDVVTGNTSNVARLNLK